VLLKEEDGEDRVVLLEPVKVSVKVKVTKTSARRRPARRARKP
jgi:hypothetical protein